MSEASATASLSGVALECRDPQRLAAFYSALTGWPVVYDSPGWVSLGAHQDADWHLSFQRAPDHRAPVWPDSASSMQAHLHLRTSDVEATQRLAVSLGARVLDPGPPTPVLADPAGHPFCLCRAPAAG